MERQILLNPLKNYRKALLCWGFTIIDFYKKVDPEGPNIFGDLFSKKRSVYSGVEETEFYLAKLYALAKGLRHKYPIIMDYFRDGELSSKKEEKVIRLFLQLKNQKIFTATLKNEELSKYKKIKEINAINYSTNRESHILSDVFADDFKKLLRHMMVNI